MKIKRGNHLLGQLRFSLVQALEQALKLRGRKVIWLYFNIMRALSQTWLDQFLPA